MNKKAMLRMLFFLLVPLAFCGCMESMVKPEAKIDTGEEMGLPPYSGPRARVAVADFEWKVDESSRTTKIGFGGQTMTIASSESSGYTTGLRDMLTTAMVQSKRYRVLERQNIDSLKNRLERINAMSREDLKTYYKEVLSNGVMSEKGGGGLGMIDIARKSGSKLEFVFSPVDEKYSFFSLSIKVVESVKQKNWRAKLCDSGLVARPLYP